MRRELILHDLDSKPPETKRAQRIIEVGVPIIFAIFAAILFSWAWRGLAQDTKDEEAWCQSHGFGHGFISKWGNGCNLPDHSQAFRWQLEQMEKQK